MSDQIKCPKCRDVQMFLNTSYSKSGAIVGGSAGAYIGYMGRNSAVRMGTLLGSMIPGLGTVIGGFTGALAGGVAGCVIGHQIGKHIDEEVDVRYDCHTCGAVVKF